MRRCPDCLSAGARHEVACPHARPWPRCTCDAHDLPGRDVMFSRVAHDRSCAIQVYARTEGESAS